MLYFCPFCLGIIRPPRGSNKTEKIREMIAKICGLQSVEAAQQAVDNGADLIGVICVPNRKRTVDPEIARSISKICHGTGTRLVGVFRNQPKEEVRQLAQEYELDVVQLHGDEDWQEYASYVGLPLLKRVVFPRDVSLVSQMDGEVCTPLFDSEAGGSGEKLDWQAIGSWFQDSQLTRGYLLAGGLSPDNVVEALRVPGVVGVDVSGGVETDGTKDLAKIKQFLELYKVNVN